MSKTVVVSKKVWYANDPKPQQGLVLSSSRATAGVDPLALHSHTDVFKKHPLCARVSLFGETATFVDINTTQIITQTKPSF